MSTAAVTRTTTGLVVHRASRSDVLIDRLAEVLARPPADPFESELVAVHSRGMERWVSQQLAQRIGGAAGICANVTFAFPATLVASAVQAAGGPAPAADPWHPARLVWPVVTTLDAYRDADWLAPLRARLDPRGGAGSGAEPPDRFGLARHLADLFDRYALHRPNMVLAWHDGRDEFWQARLWRAVRAAIGQPSPAERLADTVQRLRAGQAQPHDLPGRVCLFGLTALPPAHMAVLGALAAVRAVHFFLLHPSPALWAAVAEHVPELEHSPLPQTPLRSTDPTAVLARHPLLASWGRDAREMQTVVQALGTPRMLRASGPEPAPATLLGHLQAGLRSNMPPHTPPNEPPHTPPNEPPHTPPNEQPRTPPTVADDDRSVAVHGCHGRARQVQVLRDALLHLLADDPTLEPRDIVVLCPDVEDFAPLVTAVFGGRDEQAAATDHRGLPRLRARLADRSLRATNPVLATVATVLELAGDQVGVSAVLDLAAQLPVRRRFRFDDDALERLERWVRHSGARWGVDAAHRARLGVGAIGSHTLRAGLDRLLLGLALPDDGATTVGGVTPLDHVEGGDAALVGRFAELVDRLDIALRALDGPQPLAGWVAAMTAAADLLTAAPGHDAWQRQELVRLLEDVLAEGAAAGPTLLSLPEIRDLLGDRLKGRPSWANHRTGDLTFCTLVPMRSVPHRVVCLLGMDDGAFPRRPVPSSDDLLAGDPRIGDRDERSEDRQLLLDAVLAATDHLVITYQAGDERSGAERPPCVPVAELLDVLERTAVTADGRPVPVLRRHPLHDFDPANFAADAPWSFDRTAAAAAAALRQGPPVTAPFLDRPLAPLDPGDVAVADLERVLAAPVRQFLGRRLGVWVNDLPDRPEDAAPVELDKLQEWAVGDRLVTDLLHGRDPDVTVAVLAGSGKLGPGRLTEPAVADVRRRATQIVELARTSGLLTAPASRHDIDVPLNARRRLQGPVDGVRDDRLVLVSYSTIRGKHLLQAWVRLAALTAMAPGRSWDALLVGRLDRTGKPVGAVRLAPLGAGPGERRQTAAAALADLVALHDRALREPLPLPVNAAHAYARQRCGGGAVDRAAADANKLWDPPWPGERQEPAHVLAHGAPITLEELLATPPGDDDAEPGYDPEPSRFGTLACRLWRPILARCEEWER